MSKAYTIYATKMAQINENGVYITNANSYKPGVGVLSGWNLRTFQNIKNHFFNQSITISLLFRTGWSNTAVWNLSKNKALHRSDEIIDIDIGQYPEDPRSNDTPTFYVYPYYTNAGNGLYDVKSGYSEKSVQAWLGA